LGYDSERLGGRFRSGWSDTQADLAKSSTLIWAVWSVQTVLEYGLLGLEVN